MSDILELVRPEIRSLRPYRAAQYADGLVRLNANETPWRPPGDDSQRGLNRYPENRPDALTKVMADFYAVQPEQLLVTRGSSEAIDLLIRCFCRPGQDDIVICPPTFGMYEVYAQVQGAGVVSVPLDAAKAYQLDIPAILAAWTPRCKLVFVCSPNNPTGNRVPTAALIELSQALDGKGLVVVDGAYIEFADEDPTGELLARCDNVAVLRTLSKAHGLAGTRCGALLAAAPIIKISACILPPYAFSTPCTDAALASLAPAEQDEFASRRSILRQERERVASRLRELDSTVEVFASDANFLLVRVREPATFVAAAREGGVLIRDFSWDPFTKDCMRITIGTPEQNDQLLTALVSDKRAAST
jgi:histidinol-phosphate aminotransferase